MSDDIVERLRFAATDYDLSLFSKAADEIKRLRAENIEWRVAAAMAVVAFEQLEQWDMLALKPDGHGAATQDAPWARELIARALRALNMETQ